MKNIVIIVKIKWWKVMHIVVICNKKNKVLKVIKITIITIIITLKMFKIKI